MADNPFDLAEAASSEVLYDELGADRSLDMAMLRNASPDMRDNVTGASLRCRIVSLSHIRETFLRLIHDQGQAEVWVVVEVTDESGMKVCKAKFHWAVIRRIA
ncbi:hypothetical protein CHL67_00650 [Prosthecochloris sp. GSB1]|uniref:hypothetical protein n=1 Tax=Prosthecochloris sp. GSB1 TaxID=281093 RepID=UPI000B8CCB05|nr:hypothetical protein [Prosthecochloris sp. GSB1]ASQ89632.1 hypothetical protein CHL67_00650 [Prosthecochloris sp. GSB1]